MALQVQSVDFSLPVYNDSGSGATENLYTWKPERELGDLFSGLMMRYLQFTV
jgi:hypothetical protein